MPRVPSASGGALPRWLVVAGSAAIVFHLAAITIPILDMPSGPWWMPEGRRQMPPPEFAHAASGLTAVHADYLRLTHGYHLDSDIPGDIPGVQFEVRLRDKDGTLTETLNFPDPQANPWVRHRQELLARYLAPDLPIQPPQSEVIPAPGQQVTLISVWARPGEDFSGADEAPTTPDGKLPLELRAVPQHRIPRPPMGRAVMGPPDLALVMVRSYSRYLCRSRGAASAEIVRHTREPVSYSVLVNNGTPDLDEVIANFGKLSPSGEKTE
jgi:hypothetical protein